MCRRPLLAGVRGQRRHDARAGHVRQHAAAADAVRVLEEQQLVALIAVKDLHGAASVPQHGRAAGARVPQHGGAVGVGEATTS